MSEEIWKDIPGLEGKYQASSAGRIRSIRRQVRVRNGVAIRGSKVLRPGRRPNGYLNVSPGHHRSASVHRLVALAFIPNPDGKGTVNHRNGIKEDNRPENLEWATPQENMLHSRRVLGACVGEKNGCAKLSQNDVWELIAWRGFGATWSDLARAYKTSRITIRRAVNGVTWRVCR